MKRAIVTGLSSGRQIMTARLGFAPQRHFAAPWANFSTSSTSGTRGNISDMGKQDDKRNTQRDDARKSYDDQQKKAPQRDATVGDKNSSVGDQNSPGKGSSKNPGSHAIPTRGCIRQY
jgi:hypothetical protein